MRTARGGANTTAAAAMTTRRHETRRAAAGLAERREAADPTDRGGQQRRRRTRALISFFAPIVSSFLVACPSRRRLDSGTLRCRWQQRGRGGAHLGGGKDICSVSPSPPTPLRVDVIWTGRGGGGSSEPPPEGTPPPPHGSRMGMLRAALWCRGVIWPCRGTACPCRRSRCPLVPHPQGGGSSPSPPPLPSRVSSSFVSRSPPITHHG